MNPAKDYQNARVDGSDTDSDLEFQDSREVLHPGSLAASIIVSRSVPATSTTSSSSTRLTSTHATQYSESGGPQ